MDKLTNLVTWLKNQQNNKREKAVKETAYLLWKCDGEPEGKDKDYWFKAIDLVKAQQSSAPPPILILVLTIAVFALSYKWFHLKKLIDVNYEISWVILALISTITLSYVGLLNNLKDRYRDPKLILRRTKIKRLIRLLVSALFMMFISILGLLARIVINSYYEFNSLDLSSTLYQAVIILDYVILWSFVWSSILRVMIFWFSYWKEIFEF